MGERLSWVPPFISEALPSVNLPQNPQEGPFLLETEWQINRLDPRAQELFCNFLDTSEFEEGLRKMRMVLARPLGKAVIKDFRTKLAGFIFEGLSFCFLREELKGGEVLFSTKETFELYRQRYPQKPLLDRNFGLNFGIQGVTVPDGLLFTSQGGETQIVGVCEYTLMGLDQPWKQKQRKYYNGVRRVIDDFCPPGFPFSAAFLGTYLHNHYPRLSPKLSVDWPQLRMIYVVPREDNKLRRNSGEEVLHLPLTRGEFGRILTGIFQDFDEAVRQNKV